MPRVGSIDAVGVEARAAELAKRSIKHEAKLQALDLAIRMIDLTTLEGADTPGKVRALCAKAMRPDPPTRRSRRWPPSASTRTWSPARGRAAARLRRHRRVAWPRPSRRAGRRCRSSWPTCALAVDAGADEIDMVIDRGAFLAGALRAGVRRDRRRQGGLRPRAPQGHPGDRRARHATTTSAAPPGSRCSRGADFIKTSTGKISPAATLPVVAGDAGGGPRLSTSDTGARGRRQAGRRHPHRQAGDPATSCSSTRRSAPTGSRPTASASAPPPCSTTCCMQMPAPSATGHYSAPATTSDRRLMTKLDPRHRAARPIRRGLRLRPRPASRATSSPRSRLRAVHRRRVRRARRRQALRRPSTRPPRRCWPRSRRPAPSDVDRAVAAARRAYERRGARLPGAERAQVPVPHRAHPAGARPRARRAGDAGRRQADPESRDVDVPLAAAHFFYHAGWADKLEYAFPGRDAAAARRRRRRSSRGTSRC